MENLDLVLNYLKNRKDLFIELREIKNHFKGIIPKEDIDLIVDQLLKDGYVYHEAKDRTIRDRLIVETFNDHYYRISYLGLLFEGYVIAYETGQNERRIQNLKDRLLIVAAWMAGIYGIFEILKWSVSYFQTYICHCHFFLER